MYIRSHFGSSPRLPVLVRGVRDGCGRILRGGGKHAEASTGASTSAHILDLACKIQRRVTWSYFAAELMSVGDSVDQGI